MEFVNPSFLFGLAAIAIPVIIHLFNFRRFKKIYFTNVAFIKELKQETKKQSRLKHLLILLMRILAIAALVVAFAQPYYPLEDNIIQPQKQNHIGIFVDNSFSMQAESENGILLNRAVEKAREIASAYKTSDRFLLLTNDFEGRHQRFVSREEFLDLLDEVRLSPVVKSFNEVMTRMSDLYNLESNNVKTAYLISDYQTHFMTDPEGSYDTTLRTFLIPVEAYNTNNLFIDSCWFDAPVQQVNQLVKLNVRLKNSSDNLLEKIPVKLMINNAQRAVSSFDIPPNEELDISIPFTNKTAGQASGSLEINDYSIIFDDRFYFSYYVLPIVNVLSINENGSNPFLNSLFKNDTAINFRNVDRVNIEYASLKENQLIILNEPDQIPSGLEQELIRFMDEGGSVLVLPSVVANLETYNDFLTKAGGDVFYGVDSTRLKVNSINTEHPLFEGVFDDIPENLDLPVVNSSFVISKKVNVSRESIMTLQNNNNLLQVNRSGNGKLYLSAVPLNTEYSGLPNHPLFVPTFYKIAISSVPKQDLFSTIGENEIIHLGLLKLGQNEVIKIKKEGFEVIPERKKQGYSEVLLVHNQIREAGNYDILAGVEPFRMVSFNYDRQESVMQFHSGEELTTIINDRILEQVSVLRQADKPFAQAISDLSQGIKLWKWFVILALIFLLGEVILLRLMR